MPIVVVVGGGGVEAPPVPTYCTVVVGVGNCGAGLAGGWRARIFEVPRLTANTGETLEFGIGTGGEFSFLP